MALELLRNYLSPVPKGTTPILGAKLPTGKPELYLPIFPEQEDLTRGVFLRRCLTVLDIISNSINDKVSY